MTILSSRPTLALLACGVIACHRPPGPSPAPDPGVPQRATIARYAHWHAAYFDALSSGDPRPSLEEKYLRGYMPSDLGKYVEEHFDRVRAGAASLPNAPNLDGIALSTTACSSAAPFLLTTVEAPGANARRICIARLFVTSMFFQSGNEEWIRFRQFLIREGLDPRTFGGEFPADRIRDRTRADWNAVLGGYQPIVDKFAGSLDFVLAHQLARVALPPNASADARDAMAVAIVRKLNGSVDLRAAIAVFDGSAPEVWGYEAAGDGGDVSSRFARIASSSTKN